MLLSANGTFSLSGKNDTLKTMNCCSKAIVTKFDSANRYAQKELSILIDSLFGNQGQSPKIIPVFNRVFMKSNNYTIFLLNPSVCFLHFNLLSFICLPVFFHEFIIRSLFRIFLKKKNIVFPLNPSIQTSNHYS